MAAAMTDAISHRGPDGDGVWTDGMAGVALGHRRLAVLDLTQAGAQPMASASGRYVITFNGEIYNFADLRRRLEQGRQNPVWRGHSDTEVLLAAIDAWGLETTLPMLEGMFAVAVWDRRERTLTLARDRFGEKPLYYGVIDGVLFFGSELRAIRAQVALGDSDVDRGAVDLLIRQSYVPAPLSIFRQVCKLPPATRLTITRDDVAMRQLPSPLAYWNAAAAAVTAMRQPFVGDDETLVDRLDELLRRSLSLRLVADVPVGSMLSGGVDSTCISAVAQKLSSRSLKTFTVGFDDQGYDEADYAAQVADVIGSDHHTLRVGATEAIDAAALMGRVYDEPFADSSQVPTFLVSRVLREHVTVALSGDGGDELFGGYTRHRVGPSLWRKLSCVPLGVRETLEGWTGAHRSRLSRTLAAATGARGEEVGRIEKLMTTIGARSLDDLYDRLTMTGQEALLLAPSSDLGIDTRGVDENAGGLDAARRFMLRDTIGYLPGDILTKVDRASMAVSLETRPPFLDTQLFDFAWSLPTDRLINTRTGKRPLRALASRYVPAALIDRPKQGFAFPIDALLRGPLRQWADDLLSTASIARGGIFDAGAVATTWGLHRSGGTNAASQLWPVLMFESWRRS